jgi:TonB family protein
VKPRAANAIVTHKTQILLLALLWSLLSPNVGGAEAPNAVPTCKVTPKIIHSEPPTISRAKLPLKGRALLEFTVSTDGRVRDPVVIETTDVGFGAAALRAVVLWKFEPLHKECRVRIPVEFKLQE